MTTQKEKLNWPTAVIILGIVGTLSVTFSPLIDRAVNGNEPAIENAINKDKFESLVENVDKLDNRSQKNRDDLVEIKTSTAIIGQITDDNKRKLDTIYKHLLKKK